MGLESKSIETPSDIIEFDNLIDTLKGIISKLRTAIPDSELEQELLGARYKINTFDTEFSIQLKSIQSIEIEIRQFIGENGDEKRLLSEKLNITEKIKKFNNELKEKNAKAAIVKDSIKYMQNDGIKVDVCPVCEKETPNLLHTLEKEWDSKYQMQLEKLNSEIEEFEKQEKILSELIEKFEELSENLVESKEKIKEKIKEIGDYLEIEITEKDDTSIILQKALKTIEEKLKDIKNSIEDKNDQLEKIWAKIESLKEIVDILKEIEKNKLIETIQSSKEYTELEKLREDFSIFSNNIETVKDAFKEASNSEAKRKVSVAGERINNYFNKIANNPAVSKLNFSVEVDNKGCNSYEFNDQDGNDLIPILSQGDLNAMALSIFLGMAYSGEIDQPLGFLILDDPSQSLGSEHKQNLAQALDDVANERRIILSSMDKEFREEALSKISKNKTIYNFIDWLPNTGPVIVRE